MVNFGISYKHLLLLCFFIVAITAQRGGGRSRSRSRSSSSSSRSRSYGGGSSSSPKKKNETCLQLFENSPSDYCTYIKLKASYSESNQTCIITSTQETKCFYVETSNGPLVLSIIGIVVIGFICWAFSNQIYKLIDKLLYIHIRLNYQNPYSKIEAGCKSWRNKLSAQEEQIILDRIRNQKFTMNGCSYSQDQTSFSGQVTVLQIKKTEDGKGYNIQFQGKDNIDNFKMSGYLYFYQNECLIQAWKNYDRPYLAGQTGDWRSLKYEGFYYEYGFWGLWSYEMVNEYQYKGTWHLHIQN